MLTRVFYMLIILLFISELVFAGTGYIPMWQHGYGANYYNIMINTDDKAAMGEITLIDVLSSTTYIQNQLINPNDTWIINSPEFVPTLGFGWGYLTSTATSGTMYGWGAIMGTLSGKVVGLTVLIPTSGF